MKWIKASERLPEFNKRVSLKWKGVPYIGQFVKRHKEPLAQIDRKRTYLEGSFVYIEWLDESPDSYREALEKEEAITPIQNALYATGRFTTDQCDTLADGIYQYIQDEGFTIARAALGEKEVSND